MNSSTSARVISEPRSPTVVSLPRPFLFQLSSETLDREATQLCLTSDWENGL